MASPAPTFTPSQPVTSKTRSRIDLDVEQLLQQLLQQQQQQPLAKRQHLPPQAAPASTSSLSLPPPQPASPSPAATAAATTTTGVTVRRPGRAWSQVAQAMAAFYAVEARGTQARESLRTIDDEISDPLRLAVGVADAELGSAVHAQRTAGDDRYAKILRILDSFDEIERHENQKLWHWWMIVACLSHIYGADWQNASTRVLRSLGLKELCSEILVMTPRRFGKTWSVAMIVCALLLSIPGFRIVVISPGSRTSGKMLEEIKRMMSRLKGAERHICGHDTSKMFVCMDPLPAGKGVKSEEARALRTMSTTSVIEVLPDNPEGQ